MFIFNDIQIRLKDYFLSIIDIYDKIEIIGVTFEETKNITDIIKTLGLKEYHNTFQIDDKTYLDFDFIKISRNLKNNLITISFSKEL